jgi:hypothetical protein
MPNDTTANTAHAGAAPFIVYVAVVLTVVMALFPPFVSLNGTEYAFFLTGPEWSRQMGSFGESLGLTARIHWIALAVQLGALWAIALGARWFFEQEAAPGREARKPDRSPSSN